MLFRLDQIQSFVEIAKHNSFSIAASHLNVTQPMISTRLKNLENAIGFRLIHRNTKAIALTPNGALFLERCLEILESIANAERLVSQIGGNARPVRVGAVPTHSWRRWTLLQSFMRRYPQAVLEVDTFSSTVIAEKLLKGELDIGFIHRRGTLPLEEVGLLDGHYGLVSRADGKPGPPVITLSDLPYQEVALFPRPLDPTRHDELTQALEAIGVRTVAIPETTDEGIVNFVRRIGTPVVALKPWGDDSAPADLTFQDLSDVSVRRELVIARASRTTAAAELLWEHCLSAPKA